MRISTIIDKKEKRVAITPDMVSKYLSLGMEVVLPSGIGVSAGFSDEDYKKAGAEIVLKDFIDDADIYACVKPSFSKNGKELKLKKGSILVGLLSPFLNKKHLKKVFFNGVELYALEKIPRITRAQTMDVLSSQANIAGYKAIIEAVSRYNRIIPLMMTAAGTIRPAKVLILGAGVAGLQAIATAKRLGAIVYAFDVRAAAKEQVESLGAKFIEVLNTDSGETSGGYAKEMDDNYKKRQKQKISEVLSYSDIVITTAQIPGKKAPLLITKDILDVMQKGSIIVDMSCETGGNVEGAKLDEVIEEQGITIIGFSDLAARISYDSSKLFAKNMFDFLSLLIQSKKNNEGDEILDSSRIIFEKDEEEHEPETAINEVPKSSKTLEKPRKKTSPIKKASLTKESIKKTETLKTK